MLTNATRTSEISTMQKMKVVFLCVSVLFFIGAVSWVAYYNLTTHEVCVDQVKVGTILRLRDKSLTFITQNNREISVGVNQNVEQGKPYCAKYERVDK
jgi:hypothetical protein